MKYTIEERNEAQNKTFELKKKGYIITRIITKVLIGIDKTGKSTYDSIVTSFGYSKNKDIPKEIHEDHIDKYNFDFIYYN